MTEAVNRIEQAVVVARPFVEVIRVEQRQQVFSVLADTICRNFFGSREFGDFVDVADELGVPMKPTITRYQRQFAKRAAATSETLPGTDVTRFTTKPELLGLFSSFTNAAQIGNREELSSCTERIVASKNASLIFAAIKTPGADDSIYDLAVTLGKLGHFEYMTSTFVCMKKKTPASRALARAIADTCPAAVISDLYTNEGVDEGSKESYYLVSGLSKTKDYKSIFEAYEIAPVGSKERLMLCQALASSGDYEIIGNAQKYTFDEECLTILNCGTQSVGIYSKIKTALNEFEGR